MGTIYSNRLIRDLLRPSFTMESQRRMSISAPSDLRRLIGHSKVSFMEPSHNLLVRFICQVCSTIAEEFSSPQTQASEIDTAAYLIGDIEVTDPEAYAKYSAGVPATIAAFGGKFLVRGAQADVAEGTWASKRLVILEFESMDRLKAWFNSPEYADLKKLRKTASKGNLIFADGA